MINPLVLYFLGDGFLELSIQNKLMTIGIFIIVEFLIIITLVKKFFHGPILKLEHTIKNFLV
jgi:hypothetical protein